MARARHPNKEIEAAIQHAEASGWTVTVGGAHAWGFLWCSHSGRDGCRRPVWSTPRNPEAHARDLIRSVNRCPHQEKS